MNRRHLLALACTLILALPESAIAYVGPGAGITAIGSVLALIAAVVFAIVGFLWYPLKRWSRRRKGIEKARADAVPSQPIEKE